MTITYRNGFRDRLAFAAYSLPRHPVIILVSVGFILYFTFGALVPAMRKTPADEPLAVRIIGFIFVESLLVAFIVALFAVITILTMISRKDKPLYCQRALTLNDDGFVTESEYGRSEAKWSIVQKLGRTRSHIFMFLNQQNAVVIPRRAFESAAQWDIFYETCRRGRSRVAEPSR